MPDAEILALDHSARGRHKIACQMLAEATELRPNSVTAWHARGVAESAAGRHADAEQSFSTAIALDAEVADVYHVRALARRELRRNDAAVADLNKVLKLNPDSLAAQFDLGLVEFERGNLAAAETAVTAAIDGGYPETRCDLFRSRVRRKAGDTVCAGCRLARRIDPRTANRERLVGPNCGPTPCRCENRRCKTANAAASDTQIRPDLAGQGSHRRRDAGRLGRCRAAMEEVIRRAPEDAAAYASRGVSAARAGDYAAARADANKALALSDRPDVVYQVAGILALTAQERPADRERALFLLQRAVHHDYGADLVDRDPELTSVRNLPEVRAALKTGQKQAVGG